MLVRELRVSYEARPDLPTCETVRLGTPREAAAFLMPIFEPELVEVFGILCLTTKHTPICWYEVSRGTLDRTVVHPREVFRAAFLANTSCLIAAHNHPSGDPTPSPDDATLAYKLVEAGELLSVPVADVMIFGDRRYYSFKENGRL